MTTPVVGSTATEPWAGPAVTVTLVGSISSFGSVSFARTWMAEDAFSGTVAVSSTATGGAGGAGVTVTATSAVAQDRVASQTW